MHFASPLNFELNYNMLMLLVEMYSITSSFSVVGGHHQWHSQTFSYLYMLRGSVRFKLIVRFVSSLFAVIVFYKRHRVYFADKSTLMTLCA